jgi:hypothetical protein
MRIEVKVSLDAEAEYRAWVASNRLPPTGSNELARLLEAELLGELERTEGKPSGYVTVTTATETYRVWRFNSNTWVRYVLHHYRLGLIRGWLLKVVITGIARTPAA